MSQTDFEHILNDMLSLIPDSLDKREGSIIYDAIAPAAAALATAYINLELILRRCFADTATGDDLQRRCAERGIVRISATNAVCKAEFTDVSGNAMTIPTGARFCIGSLTYAVDTELGDGSYRIVCEQSGSIGNLSQGTLVAISDIQSLANAKITALLVAARDEESDAQLRERYFSSFDSMAFGGNIADYISRITAIDGVGAVKIFPAWNGGGTVKAVCLASDLTIPDGDLINTVQQLCDPDDSSGSGYGFAPIGHCVTVVPASPFELDVNVNVTLQDGYSLSAVEPSLKSATEHYLLQLCESWHSQKQTVVRISQLEHALLDIEGVIDVDATLNSSSSNIVLASEQVPVLSSFTVSV